VKEGGRKRERVQRRFFFLSVLKKPRNNKIRVCDKLVKGDELAAGGRPLEKNEGSEGAFGTLSPQRRGTYQVSC